MTDVLSPTESTRLEKCEVVIEKGLQTFIEVGNALLEIRDSRLYRQEFDTFEDYCRKRWEMSKTSANRLIQAAEVAENLTPVGVTPTSERQVRPLAKLEPEEQREAWETAVETTPNGKPTAAQVDAVVNQLKAPSKPDNPPKVDSWTRHDQSNLGDQDTQQNSQPEIPKANLKKLVGELWATALRNVPPKQEIVVAKLFLEMLHKKFAKLKIK